VPAPAPIQALEKLRLRTRVTTLVEVMLTVVVLLLLGELIPPPSPPSLLLWLARLA
jgi:hypothetical protein